MHAKALLDNDGKEMRNLNYLSLLSAALNSWNRHVGSCPYGYTKTGSVVQKACLMFRQVKKAVRKKTFECLRTEYRQQRIH